MKEIDFLPGWYKSGRRRQVGYRTQYVALGGVLIVMVVWNFVAGRSISRARAEFAQTPSRQAEAEAASRQFASLKTQIANLQKKAQLMEQIDSKIDVASVLAEMSFLIDRSIAISTVEFVAEKFAERQGPQSNNNNVARVALSVFNQKQSPIADVRFKVVIRGIAADAGDVAALICKLEGSPYFCQVVPSFSRNAEISVANYPSPASPSGAGGQTKEVERDFREAGKKVQVSEFEISCYLANYRQ